MLTEFVLDGDVDEDDEDVGCADAEGLLCDEKYEEDVDPPEFDNDVRDRIQQDRLIVFRLDEE